MITHHLQVYLGDEAFARLSTIAEEKHTAAHHVASALLDAALAWPTLAPGQEPAGGPPPPLLSDSERHVVGTALLAVMMRQGPLVFAAILAIARKLGVYAQVLEAAQGFIEYANSQGGTEDDASPQS